jgi:hypothetical protein
MIYEIVIKKVPYISNLLLDKGVKSVKIYWLTTVEIESTTKIRLITNGRSFSFENISVTKNPIDWSKDAWQREDNAAINKNGHTDLSLYERFEATFLTVSFEIIFFGKLI